MGSVVAGLLSTTVGTAGGADKISLNDIEAQLRGVAARAQGAISESKSNLIASGIVGGVLVIAAAYLHGRRRGRRHASVLEIRRI